MKISITKIIETVVLVISIAFILWLLVSWAEVVSKNLKPNPIYSSWNAWVLITKGDR